MEMKNVHCKIAKEIHKVLVVHALDRNMNLEDILREIITDAADNISKKKAKGETENGR